ncbi:MAG: TonB-dependent receptor plug domain-containing protein, partial [Gammaproteobacteria bacterium]|nr:TonB-dependent receptor plug domain-containing protein [Gammaproteobacteria bacterium]
MFRSGGIKAVSIVTGVVLAGGLFSGSIANAQDDGASALEEIIVTATKRDATLAEIPMSVSVLGGDTMERQRILNFQDMVPLVPGLSITGSASGLNRITLRGLNTSGVAS